MNVNEFKDYEDYYDNRQVKVGKWPSNNRVLKALPITKESFLHWKKQSVLKSFATSQEASFVSHRPTERQDTSRIMNENINPSKILQREQKIVDMEILNKDKNYTKYNTAIEESPECFSSPFVDESSGYFEEYQHQVTNRETSKASSRYEIDQKASKNNRQEKLHN